MMKRHFTQFLAGLTALLLWSASQAVAQDAPTLYGTMISSDSWWDGNEYGVYSFKAQSQHGLTKIYGDSQFNATGGAAYHGGKYYVMKANDYGEGVESVSLYVYDTAEWEQEDEDELSVTYMATDFAENPLTHQLYGVCSDGQGGMELAIIDFQERTRTKVGALGVNLMTLACDGTGQLYGIATNGNLYLVSSTDASLAIVGNTGVKPDVTQSMTFDWATGKLYWAASYEDGEEGPVSRLYEVSTKDGSVSTVSYFNNTEQLVGLYCLNELQQWEGPDAPVAPADVQAAISNDQVTLTWTAPTKGLHGGEVDFANMTYSVVRYPGGETVAEGLTTTTFSEPLVPETMTVYYYEVTAWASTLQGGTARSNAVVAGDFLASYTHDFKNADASVLLTTIDNDGDGYTWEFSPKEGYAYVPGAPFESTDDWLLSPAISLSADRLYRVATTTWCEWAGNYPYNVATYFGQEANAEAMEENEIYSQTRIGEAAHQQQEGYFQVDEAGRYHVAVRVYGYDIQNVCLNQFSIEQGPMLAAPAAVGSLTATAGAEGTATATLTFTAPGQTIGGETLEALTKIEVYRGDELISTIEAPAVGSQQTVTDEAPVANATNSYRVVAYNSYGEGMAATTSVYVGEDIPMAPTNVRLTDEGDKAVLTWDAPTTGKNGGYINPQNLRYGVADQTGNIIATDLTECRYEYPLKGAGSQQYLFFGVGAYNTIGQSAVVASTPIVTGTPYTLPFDEHVTGGTMTYFWGSTQYGSDSWPSSFYPTSYDSDVDGDGGHFTFSSGEEGSGCRLYSGKISLAGAVNPILEFYYDYRQEAYDEEGETATLRVSIIKNGGEAVVVKEIQPIKFHEIDLEHPYNHAVVSLKGVADDADYIQVQFDVEHHGTTQANLDAITVRDQQDYDLAATLTAPATAKSGDELQLTAAVTNLGAKTAEGYTVELYEGSELVATLEGETVEPFTSKTYTFPITVNTLKGELSYYAVVNYDADQAADNNTTEAKAIAVTLPIWPTPADVMATAEEAAVNLSWTTPAYELYAVPTTESAEQLSATDLGEWTTIDGDQLATDATIYVGWDELTFEGKGNKMGWCVMDPAALGIPFTNWWDEPTGWQPTSGSKLFASIGSSQGANDDWLISPELTDDEQTITFQINGTYNDAYQVLYSTTDRETGSFTALTEAISLSGSWQLVSFELPAGAKYFAIRNVSSSYPQYVLVDDITFQSAAGKGALTLNGYNVYRDGKLIGTATETTFTDTEATEGSHVYQVTAVYNLGESAAAQTEVTVATGITTVANGQQRIVERYTIDGKRTTAPQRGINIIRMSDGSVRKVTVR